MVMNPMVGSKTSPEKTKSKYNTGMSMDPGWNEKIFEPPPSHSVDFPPKAAPWQGTNFTNNILIG